MPISFYNMLVLQNPGQWRTKWVTDNSKNLLHIWTKYFDVERCVTDLKIALVRASFIDDKKNILRFKDIWPDPSNAQVCLSHQIINEHKNLVAWRYRHVRIYGCLKLRIGFWIPDQTPPKSKHLVRQSALCCVIRQCVEVFWHPCEILPADQRHWEILPVRCWVGQHATDKSDRFLQESDRKCQSSHGKSVQKAAVRRGMLVHIGTYCQPQSAGVRGKSPPRWCLRQCYSAQLLNFKSTFYRCSFGSCSK